MAERDVLPLAGDSFTAVALRFATVYGPSRRMRFDLVVNAMTLSAMQEGGRIYVEGDGMQQRPLVHVLDVARAVAMMLEAPRDRVSGGEAFNVGSDGQNYRIIDVAKEVQAITGSEVAFRGGEVDKRSYAVSFRKIRSLGYDTLYAVGGDGGVRQVYHEVLLGYLRPEERWWTVKWYKRLLGK